MAKFCTARSFPFPPPSWRVVTATFDSAVDEGAYLSDLILPSSSPVKNRGIFCWVKKEDVRRVRAGEMDLRFIRAKRTKRVKSDGGGLTATANNSQA